MCTGGEERQESKRLALCIAAENGYAVPSHQRTSYAGQRRQTPRQGKLPLCIPFISDRVSAPINRSIVRAQLQNDVVSVNIPNDNIKQQLVRNRLYDKQCITPNCIICPYGKPGDCDKACVIYEL